MVLTDVLNTLMQQFGFLKYRRHVLQVSNSKVKLFIYIIIKTLQAMFPACHCNICHHPQHHDHPQHLQHLQHLKHLRHHQHHLHHLNEHPPSGLHGHGDERDDGVRGGEVEHQVVHIGPAL